MDPRNYFGLAWIFHKLMMTISHLDMSDYSVLSEYNKCVLSTLKWWEQLIESMVEPTIHVKWGSTNLFVFREYWIIFLLIYVHRISSHCITGYIQIIWTVIYIYIIYKIKDILFFVDSSTILHIIIYFFIKNLDTSYFL